MKAYTDIEQSKELAKFLSFASADMGWYYSRNPQAARTQMWAGTKAENADIPCFSLSALLRVIPKRIKDYNVLRIDISEKDFSIWYDEVGNGVNTELPDITMECPVDACVEMILKLKEMNLL